MFKGFKETQAYRQESAHQNAHRGGHQQGDSQPLKRRETLKLRFELQPSFVNQAMPATIVRTARSGPKVLFSTCSVLTVSLIFG